MYHKKEKVMYTNKGRYPKKDVEQIEKSIKLVESMEKRHKLEFINIYSAVCTIVDARTEQTIISLRKRGESIRRIARSIHMDDSRVSAILKENNAFKICGKTRRG